MSGEKGRVPEGWEWKKLSDLGSCLGGLTYSPDDVVESDGLLVLRSSNVQNGLLSFEDNVYVRKDIRVKHLTQEKDILVCVRNGSKNLIGKNAVITRDAIGMAHGAFMMLFRATNPDFVYQLFQTSWYEEQVKANLGATINSINSKDFLSYTFLVPPLPEQRKIAAILSTWDDSLATLTDLIAAKRQQKRGLAEALLTGQKRLPGFEGEWEETRFSSVMQESRISAPDELGKRLTVSLHLKGVSVREERDSSEAGKTIYYRRKTGQFIYGKQNIFRGSLGLVPQELDGYLSSQDLPAFDIAPEYDPAFVFAFFARPKFYEELEKIATGTGSKRVHPEAIYRLSYPLPPLPEQQAIASILSTLDAEIASLEALGAKVQEQKRGLMDELLTGRVRVKVDE